MRKSFHLGVLAGVALVGLLPQARAQAIAVVEENGRKVYVNDLATIPERPQGRQSGRRYRLVYWSVTEKRWKPVPTLPTLRAAQTAAAEVNQQIAALGAPLAPQPAITPGPALSSPATRQATPAQLDAIIESAAARHKVDPNLVRAVIKVESNYNPRAVSRKGAMGLMQLMPKTARGLSVANPFDPQQNVDAGVRHLRSLLETNSGDVGRSLAAYNAGQTAVERSRGIPPYRETRQYVDRITALYGNGSALTGGSGNIRVYRGANGVLTITNTD